MRNLIATLSDEVLINFLLNKDFEHPYDMTRIELEGATFATLEAMDASIGFNSFALRHIAKDGNVTRTSYSTTDLCILTEICWADKEPGFREGVWLVNVPADGFTCPYKKIEPSDKLISKLEARREGEEAVLTTYIVGSEQTQADSCQIVVYSHDALAENGENSDDKPYEIVSINGGSDKIGEIPMSPVTMARNTLEKVGGSATSYPADEWAKSVWFHSTHAIVLPE